MILVMHLLTRRRKLEGSCTAVCGNQFQGWSCDSVYGAYSDFVNEEAQCVNGNGDFGKTRDKDDQFETCFALGSQKGSILCWSKSRYSSQWDRETPCVPEDRPDERWYLAQPKDDQTCGRPCRLYGEFEESEKEVDIGIITKENDICTKPAFGKKFHIQGWSCDKVSGKCSDIVNEEEQCVNGNGDFKKTKDKDETFETCFALGKPTGVICCWSKSFYSSKWDRQMPCVAKNEILLFKHEPWFIAQPRRWILWRAMLGWIRLHHVWEFGLMPSGGSYAWCMELLWIKHRQLIGMIEGVLQGFVLYVLLLCYYLFRNTQIII